jgi:RNA exonuclease 1
LRHLQRWSCCQGPIISRPCANQDVHTVRNYATRELEDQWRFFHTPYHRDDNHPKFARAIAIDCEMGTNEYGESELIRVSVVDYFTGAVLLDKLVWPDVKMKHYNTKYSGVTAKAMHDARRSRTCLFGRGAARKAIWKFVSPETVVIGHAVHGDLTSLRWIHHRIVDTLLLEEAYAKKVRQKLEREWEEEQERKRQEVGEEGAVEEEPQEGEDKTNTERKEEGPKIPQMPMGLKALAKERLDRMIQVGGRGHDSVEDALATRDLLHWHMVHRAAKIQ